MKNLIQRLFILATIYATAFSLSATLNFNVNGIKYEAESTSSTTATVVGFMPDNQDATLSIPNRVNYYGISFVINEIKSGGGVYFKKLVIPSSITNIDFSPYPPHLQEIEVAEDNDNYKTADNVLYTKDMTQLIYYPSLDERTEFTVPDEVKAINTNGFYCPTFLKKISILHKCSLQNNAFCYCDALETLELDFTDEDLNNNFKPVYDSNAFISNNNNQTTWKWRTLILGKNLCDSSFLKMETYLLDNIIVNPDNNYFCSENGMLYSKDMKKLYRVASYYNDIDLVIPEPVEEIGRYAFMSNSDYTCVNSITFPSTLRYLPNTIRNAKSLGWGSPKTIIFEDGKNLTSIPDSLFYNLVGIGKVVLSNNIKYIGTYSFYQSSSHLGELVLPHELDSIGESAFEGNRLTEIKLPANLKRIAKRAFYSLDWFNKNYYPTIVTLAKTPPECELITLSETDYHGNVYYWEESPFHVDREIIFEQATLIIPKGTKSAYENAPVWEKFKNIVEVDTDCDVNEDFVTNSADVTALYNYILQGDERFKDKCDVNGDGVINAADVTFIYNNILGTEGQ